jgi:hypothetical protein
MSRVTGATRKRGISMTKVRSLLTAGAVLASPGAAIAAGQATTHISGSLPQTCGVTAPANQIFDPASIGVQPIGSATYQCNFSGTANLRFWTQNSGAAIAPAGSSNNNVAQSQVYNFTFDGTSLGRLSNAAGSAAAVVRPIVSPNVGQSGAASIQLTSPATIAGTYADTIFVSIAP